MKNPERLIGRKVKGFKFDKSWYLQKMDNYIGKIGIIKEYLISDKWFGVEFLDGQIFGYPADQIEAHLVEEEIPTLSDGVMMLVSDDKKEWFTRKVIGRKGIYYYYWHGDVLCKMSQCKPLEPTKEEQLTAILGNDEKVKEIMELFKN